MTSPTPRLIYRKHKCNLPSPFSYRAGDIIECGFCHRKYRAYTVRYKGGGRSLEWGLTFWSWLWKRAGNEVDKP